MLEASSLLLSIKTGSTVYYVLLCPILCQAWNRWIQFPSALPIVLKVKGGARLKAKHCSHVQVQPKAKSKQQQSRQRSMEHRDLLEMAHCCRYLREQMLCITCFPDPVHRVILSEQLLKFYYCLGHTYRTVRRKIATSVHLDSSKVRMLTIPTVLPQSKLPSTDCSLSPNPQIEWAKS